MFQPLEVTEARTIWIDSPGNDRSGEAARLGFQDSSRVQIDRDPVGTGDFSETGDGFKATLLGGMWPDDDELRLLVVGIVPDSEKAEAYLNHLVNHKTFPTDYQDAAKEVAWDIMRGLVQIMPSWGGQQERVMFVSSKLPRVKPETVKTAAVNSEPDRKLSFDMFRIQVDAMLIANKQEPSDKWKGDVGHASLSVMRRWHKNGATPKEYVDNYKEKVHGRDTTPGQGPPA